MRAGVRHGGLSHATCYVVLGRSFGSGDRFAARSARAARIAARSTSRLLVTTRTSFQRLSLDSGRDSTISTVSPRCDSFVLVVDVADRLAVQELAVLGMRTRRGFPPAGSWPSCRW